MEILGGILWLLVQVVGEFVLEAGLEIAFEVLKEAGRAELPALASTAGYVILGAALGGISAWLLPRRLLRPFPIPGLSMMLVPVIIGCAMEAWGSYRRAAGCETTSLATWYGGGGFAFGLACARYLALP